MLGDEGDDRVGVESWEKVKIVFYVPLRYLQGI
jgi:hypothetical protein